MPNTNQVLFIVIIVIIFSLSLIGIFYMMNKASSRRRDLFDLEQRLQLQEQLHIEYLATKQQPTVIYQPAMVKQNHSPVPSPVIMTPHKKTKRDSILEKVYGFRNVSNSPPPFLPIRPSAARPPSFLPMQEKRSPPAYGDYGNSTPIDSKH